MSHYGRDGVPSDVRYRGAEHFIYSSRTPVTKRVGAGHRARVTVETGAEDDKYRQEQLLSDASRRERKADEIGRLRLRRWEPHQRPDTQYIRMNPRRRRNSLPFQTKYSSPVHRRSRLGDDLAEELADLALENQRLRSRSLGRSEIRVTTSKAPSAKDYAGRTHSSIDDDDDDEGEHDAENFDFDLPKILKTVKYSEDHAFTVPESTSNDSFEQPPSTKPKFGGPMTKIEIAHSQWIGNIFERGDLVGQIAVMPDSPEQAGPSPVPMMKWYHLERSSMMNFDEFMAASQSVLRIPEREQRDVAKLLRDVQKKFEKQRHHGRELEPDCVSDVFYNDIADSSRQTASVMFL